MRRSIAGVQAIGAALLRAEPVQLVLVSRDEADPAILQLVTDAEQRGAVVWRGGPGDMARMSRGAEAGRVLALLGAPIATDLNGLCARGGASWLLHRAAYPSNVGFAIRTAEVSGAQGVIVDAHFNHDQRSRASHVSMGADRVMPVLWEDTEDVLAAARAHGMRVVAIEAPDEAPDEAASRARGPARSTSARGPARSTSARGPARSTSARMTWDVDLSGDVLLIVGNERHGIAPELLARCDAIASVPMAGFVPSYNLHAAIAAVATERLRQLAQSRARA